MTFKKVTQVRLPFDMRHAEDGKNYGIHGLDIWFILIGPKGAVQFAVTFPTYLPHVELYDRPDWTYQPKISGFDVGYHSPKPMYEDQAESACELLEGGKCYYDGSSLQADDWVKELFSTKGERIEPLLWAKLEQEYKDRFETEGNNE
jgi:hypothetical protein